MRTRLWSGKYEVHMKKLFYNLGYSIGCHPWRWISLLLCCTALSSIGFVRFHQINNARYTFTASDSESHREGAILSKFLRQNGSLHMLEVMIKAQDNSSLLRPEYTSQLERLSEELTTHVTVPDTDGNPIGYQNMCEPYCNKNDAFFAMMKLIDGNFSRVELSYPSMDVVGRSIFIANNVYGVHLKEDGRSIASFDTVILHLFLTHSNLRTMIRWEDEVMSLIHSDKYPLLRVGAASDNLVAKEVRAMGTQTAPLLATALALLMLFLVICSIRYKRRESKPFEAMLGGATPILAALTTIGLVSASGLAFQSIVVSSLFLLLAIGIDDVFIMLAAWHRTEKSKHAPQRVAEMVRESGCSMTVTSVTNLISFGNGVLSTTPTLQTFAIYSVVASVVCYLYQLILFPSIIALTAHRESLTEEEERECCTSLLPDESPLIAALSDFHDSFFRRLAKACESTWMRAAVLITLVAYWAVSVYGISVLETDLSIQKIALPNSKLVAFKNEYDDEIKAMQAVAVVVQQPGDLRDEQRLARLRSLFKAFENTTYSYGSESTLCWLDGYMEFLEFYQGTDEEEAVVFTYRDLPAYLDQDGAQWKATVHIDVEKCKANSPGCLKQFIFTTGFTTVVRYRDIYPLLVEFRQIAADYPELEVVSYTDRSNFADQSVSLEPVIWETLYSEVLCMGLSFLVFIPDLISIAAAMFSLVSVNLGVFGMLSLWGVGIDPFSMASLLMSIGFSVDISAHISYHYYEIKEGTPRQRLEETFLEIGWPTVQGGMSTMLAMTLILLRPSYLGLVFLKTVALVTVFGLIHGLLVLPVLLSLFDKLRSPSDKVAPLDIPPLQPHRISLKSVTRKSDQI